MKLHEILDTTENKSLLGFFDVPALKNLISTIKDDIQKMNKNDRSIKTYENDIIAYEQLIDFITDKKGPFIDLISDRLHNMDTAPRDAALKCIDKKIWDRLGFKPLK